MKEKERGSERTGKGKRWNGDEREKALVGFVSELISPDMNTERVYFTAFCFMHRVSRNIKWEMVFIQVLRSSTLYTYIRAFGMCTD